MSFIARGDDQLIVPCWQNGAKTLSITTLRYSEYNYAIAEGYNQTRYAWCCYAECVMLSVEAPDETMCHNYVDHILFGKMTIDQKSQNQYLNSDAFITSLTQGSML